MKQSALLQSWNGNPPEILILTTPMPDGVYLSLSGCGCARMPLASFLKNLELDFENKKGSYWAYVCNTKTNEQGEHEDADTYCLADWDVLTGSKCYQTVVVLYYRPVAPLATIKKHMPQFVDEYLKKHPEYNLEELERILEKQDPTG